VIINFIDRDFVCQIFDEKLLLAEVNAILGQIVEAMVPEFDFCTNKYYSFYKAQ
jgi:hypothetical protein